jgi:hypothetical protein
VSREVKGDIWDEFTICIAEAKAGEIVDSKKKDSSREAVASASRAAL